MRQVQIVNSLSKLFLSWLRKIEFLNASSSQKLIAFILFAFVSIKPDQTISQIAFDSNQPVELIKPKLEFVSELSLLVRIQEVMDERATLIVPEKVCRVDPAHGNFL